MIEINLKGIPLLVVYEITPADEDVGLGERLYIHEVYYKGVDVLEIILALDGNTDIMDLEDELWDRIEKER